MRSDRFLAVSASMSASMLSVLLLLTLCLPAVQRACAAALHETDLAVRHAMSGHAVESPACDGPCGRARLLRQALDADQCAPVIAPAALAASMGTPWWRGRERGLCEAGSEAGSSRARQAGADSFAT